MVRSSTSNSRIISLSPAERVSMADEWYEYAAGDHFWMIWRFNVIHTCSAVRDQQSGRWLDIGCGNGAVIRQFEADSALIIDGCDLNQVALDQIGSIRGDLYVYNIYERNPMLQGKYDTILLMDVIEHIIDEDSFLEASLSHLKPGGLVIITVPALSALKSMYDEVDGHKRRYTKRMVRRLFEKYHVEEVQISYWGLLLLPVIFLRKFVVMFVPRAQIIKTGFQPPRRWVNAAFLFIMRIEMRAFGNPFLGTSLMAVGRKPA